MCVGYSKFYSINSFSHLRINICSKNNRASVDQIITISAITQLSVNIAQGISLIQIYDIYRRQSLGAKIKQTCSGTIFQDGSAGSKVVVQHRSCIIVLGAGSNGINVEPTIASCPGI